MWLAQVPGDRWGLVPLRKMCETREFERDEMISHYHCMEFIVFTTDVGRMFISLDTVSGRV